MYDTAESDKEERKGCLKTLLLWVGLIGVILIYAVIKRNLSDNATTTYTSTSIPHSNNSDSSMKATRNAEFESFGATEVYYDMLCNSDPCCSLASGTPSSYSGYVCGGSGSTSSGGSGGSSSGCPSGCTTHNSGCDIKGNVEYNTGEKIYHLVGMNFYNDTVINPDYGERWFCTEAEAKANGWRKASN